MHRGIATVLPLIRQNEIKQIRVKITEGWYRRSNLLDKTKKA
jgi:hypothetical protein